MCRRVYINCSFDKLAESFSFATRGNVDDLGGRVPRYNGAPAEAYHIIIQDAERQRERPKPAISIARWGLVPSWMDRPRRQPPVYARCEDISSNELFHDAYRSRRCLIPVSGFFEWLDISGTGKKQPYAVAMKDRSMFALAGIWEVWRHPAGIDIRSFAVVTCPANEMMAPIHNRMPVVLRAEDYGRWLSSDPNPRGLMKPFDDDAMMMWPITRRVLTVRNVGPEVINPVDLSARQVSQ
ncbi:SOS response-associated peptidase [Rhizobium sp. 9T]|uniref:Abasic site processing protein n=1 Tax=Rhizobium croatiense TaxID=2867516 RepID=A0ABS7M989_9HYPH|nr:SOS response-associated peptidase [Rhizobium croatiense]MBY4608011.1 SOS response-associated peptidase [Rhizobium croatiense]MBY4632756.1 SOS response-associated peptidase [Rhizobium croatiense]